MSINKKLKFELMIINDRLLEIQSEYNNAPCKKCGQILDVKIKNKHGFIRVSFDKFAYLIFVYKHTFMLAWFSKRDEHYYVQDGCVSLSDVSEVCRELNDRIFSGFSPFRGKNWYQYGIPKKKK